MNTEIKTLNESERKISIEMSPEEVEKYFEEILKKEAQKITIPGFRKGRAPLSLVKRMYGTALLYDNLDRIAQNRFYDEIDTQDIQIIGTPVLTDIDYKPDGALNFEIQFEVEPQIDVKLEDIEQIEVEKEEYEVSDKFVQDLMEYIRFEARDEELAEKIESTSYIIQIEARNPEKPDEDPKKWDLYLENPSLNKEFINLLIGKNLNEEFETSIPVINAEETSEEKKENTNYKYKINSIKKVSLPELNDEVAKKFSKGRFSTIEELKNIMIKEEIDYLKKEIEKKNFETIKSKLLEKYQFTPPPSFVKQSTNKLIDNLKKNNPKLEINEQLMEYLRNHAERESRWYLIYENIKNKFNLGLSKEELEEYASKLAERYNQDKEKVINYLLKSKSELLSVLEEEKFINFLLEKVKVNIKKVII